MPGRSVKVSAKQHCNGCCSCSGEPEGGKEGLFGTSPLDFASGSPVPVVCEVYTRIVTFFVRRLGGLKVMGGSLKGVGWQQKISRDGGSALVRFANTASRWPVRAWYFNGQNFHQQFVEASTTHGNLLLFAPYYLVYFRL